MLKKIVKRYIAFIIALAAVAVLTVVNSQIGFKALGVSAATFKEMLLIIPPIFIMLGLLDVWVPRETMVKYMGEGSGVKGIILAFILGSAAAGPLYGAFPVAAVFMKKGAKFMNILIFIGAWSTTKIPTLMFETASFGIKFTLTRLFVDIPGIIIIAFALSKLIRKEEVDKLYENAEKLS